MSVLMSILKIILYVLPFVLALAIGWYGLGVGLTGGPTNPITTANVLVVAAILTVALNVGWIVAYNMK